MTTLKDLRILVVEDDPIIAIDIQNMLSRLGFNAYSTASMGKEAIKKALEDKPDLILMDIMLKEDMDGIEVAERIRKRMGTPVIFISALSNEGILKRAMRTEPFFFISKPMDESELLSAIIKAYYRHNLESKTKKSKVNKVL